MLIAIESFVRLFETLIFPKDRDTLEVDTDAVDDYAPSRRK